MGRELVEQFFVIGGTNTLEVAKAVKKLTGTGQPLKKVTHKHNREYPYTYSAGEYVRPIFEVDCLHRPVIGRKRVEPTHRYIIKSGERIDVTDLFKEVRKIHEGSFDFRLQQFKKNTGKFLNQVAAAYPLI